MDNIETHWHTLHTNFLNHFTQTLTNFDSESIHQFRLSLKKLFALNTLLQHTNPELFLETNKYICKFKPLFKSAGQIRNAQIKRDLLLKYSYSDLIPNLDEIIIGRVNNFKSLLTNPLPSSLSLLQKEIHTFSISKQHQLEELLLSFFNANLSLIQHWFVTETNYVKYLHKSRTIIKQHYYLIQLTNVQFREKRFDEKITKAYRQVEQSIGQWHDLLITSQFIKKVNYTLSNQLEIDLKKMENVSINLLHKIV